MPAASLHPLRFEPILRQLIWGGRRLGTVLHKPIGAGNDYAESWELADYRDAVSMVNEGALAGTTLRDLVHQRGPELLGPGLPGRDEFPLLVKFIDAREVLSVQVHPDDEKGKRLAGDNGKTETWVIVDAEPGSLIYAGLGRGSAASSSRRPSENRQGRAPAASLPGQARRLCHDRRGNRPCHRGRGSCWRRSSRCRTRPSGSSIGDAWEPTAEPRELHLGEALESTDSPQSGQSLDPHARNRQAREHMREAVALPLLRARPLAAGESGRRGPDRSVHDLDGDGRQRRRPARRAGDAAHVRADFTFACRGGSL